MKILETLTIVNRDSGVSNNMMAYRLALIMEKYSSQIQPTTTLDSTERENLQTEMRTKLSLCENTQITEEYRQNKKNKYYQEYLQKFGIKQEQDNSTRVENLIASKKQVFLQQIFETKHQSPLTSPQAQGEVPVKNTTPSLVNDENYSLIPAIMNTVVTMGKDTHQGRIYEGIAYRLQLWFKEGIQLISVGRKNGTPENAFIAHKDRDGVKFKVTENNLSDEEAQRIINFTQSPDAQHSQTDNTTELDDSAEIGD